MFRRCHKRANLIKEAVEVHVHTLPREGVKEDILAVAVPQAEDVAHHGHDGCGAAVYGAAAVPADRKTTTTTTFLDQVLTKGTFPQEDFT